MPTDSPPAPAAAQNVPYEDDLSVRETFVESVHVVVDGNQLLRMEFAVFRPDHSDQTATNRRICVARLMMTKAMAVGFAANITKNFGPAAS